MKGCLFSVCNDNAQPSSKINNRYASIVTQSPLTYYLFDVKKRKVRECGAGHSCYFIGVPWSVFLSTKPANYMVKPTDLGAYPIF